MTEPTDLQTRADHARAQALRESAARLLTNARALDHKNFYAVTHTHHHGSDIYYGWFQRRPSTEQMAALVEDGGGRYTPQHEESLEPNEAFAREYPVLCGSEMEPPMLSARQSAGAAAHITCLLPASAPSEEDPQPAWASFVVDEALLGKLHLAELMVQAGACSRMDVPVDGTWGPPGFNDGQLTEMVVAVEATLGADRVVCNVRGFNYGRYADGPLVAQGQFTVGELRGVWLQAEPGTEHWLRSSSVASESYAEWQAIEGNSDGAALQPRA